MDDPSNVTARRLRLATHFDELNASPIGHALAGNSFVAWCFSPRLGGTVHFGQRHIDDAAVLMRMYTLIGHRALRLPLRRVIDGREFTGVDDEAWELMVGRLGPRMEGLRGIIERQAIIVRAGPDGIRAAALLPALGPGDAYRVFEDAESAYVWADPDNGAAAYAAVEQLMAELRGSPRLASSARAWIANNLRAARVEACAEALGVSQRSLQRHLATVGLSFRTLVSAVRVDIARSLLVEGDAKITTVAHAVGCSSSSQLAVLLRRAGESIPSTIRARRPKL